MRRGGVVVAVGWARVAVAQDADTLGPMPVLASSPSDPVFVWRPASGEVGLLGGVSLHRSGGLLRTADGDPLIVGAEALQLSAGYRPHPRLTAGVGVPVALTHGALGGVGVGDVQAWAAIGLIVPSDHGFGLSVVPSVRLGTARAGAAIGEARAVSASGVVAASYGVGRVGFSANLGVRQRAWADIGPVDALPTVAVPVGAAVSVDLGRLGASAELWAEPAVGGVVGAPAGVFAPAQATLSARGRVSGPWLWTAGVSAGLTRGIGVSPWRAMVGVTLAPPPRDAAPQDRPKATPSAAPVLLRVSVRDQQGRPVNGTIRAFGVSERAFPVVDGVAAVEVPPGRWRLVLAAPGFGGQTHDLAVSGASSLEWLVLPDEGDDALQFTVSDADGPVSASVRVDGRPVGLASGTTTISDLASGKHDLELSASGYRTVLLRSVVSPASVVLDRLPGSVQVAVRAATGAIPAATVRLEGKLDGVGTVVRLPPAPVGEAGRRDFVLRPGTWTMTVEAPKYGVQEREFAITPEDVTLSRVEVVLQRDEGGPADMAVRVVDAAGRPVSGVTVRLDDRLFGTTASGGALWLDGLDAGQRTLRVSSPELDDAEQRIALVPGAQEIVAIAKFHPGLVRVSARGPVGPVHDATARFSGDASFGPVPLGPTGRATVTAAPGAWTAVVASPTAGVQSRPFEVSPDAALPVDVDVVFDAGLDGDGGASLRVKVTDPDDAPLARARVSYAGEALGSTGNLGVVVVSGLPNGSGELAVTGPPLAPKKQAVKVAGDTSVGVRLDWGVGATRVTVLRRGAPVTDAVLRAAGPAGVSPRPVDAAGRAILQLTPGDWQVVAVSPTAGLGAASLTVPSTPGLRELEIALPDVDDGGADLLVRIVDPDGAPVRAAQVSWACARPGCAEGTLALGATGSGGRLIAGGLPLGRGRLVVTAPGILPVDPVPVDLIRGVQERIVPVAWRPGAVAVRVTDVAGKPLLAHVQLQGPSDVPAVDTAADGAATLSVRPGVWTVLASAVDRGTRAARVTVTPGGSATVGLQLGAAVVSVDARRMQVAQPVPFAFGSADLDERAGPVLDELAATLLAHPEILVVEVQGHTDDRGNLTYNFDLSARRADAVVDALAGRGVPRERLLGRGYGATRPIAPNDTDDRRAQNRRVQLEVVETYTP
jgi:outer membrane protein OmpA-like peptidoglycan-associated protein